VLSRIMALTRRRWIYPVSAVLHAVSIRPSRRSPADMSGGGKAEGGRYRPDDGGEDLGGCFVELVDDGPHVGRWRWVLVVVGGGGCDAAPGCRGGGGCAGGGDVGLFGDARVPVQDSVQERRGRG